jgi:predicted CopG family antitoxin
MDEQNSTGKSSVVLKTVIAILAIGVCVLGFFVYQELKTENKSFKDMILDITKGGKKEEVVEEDEVVEIVTDNTEEEETKAPTISFTKDEIENIKAILDTLNTQPLLGYMDGDVMMYYDSAVLSETLNSTKATLKLGDYFAKAKTPWTFPLTEEQKAEYASKSEFKKFFGGDCLTGISNNYLVSLCFNEGKKITKMLFSNDMSIY